jgi:hypothetical protein
MKRVLKVKLFLCCENWFYDFCLFVGCVGGLDTRNWDVDKVDERGNAGYSTKTGVCGAIFGSLAENKGG